MIGFNWIRLSSINQMFDLVQLVLPGKNSEFAKFEVDMWETGQDIALQRWKILQMVECWETSLCPWSLHRHL